jgi:hypothetical protein
MRGRRRREGRKIPMKRIPKYAILYPCDPVKRERVSVRFDKVIKFEEVLKKEEEKYPKTV